MDSRKVLIAEDDSSVRKAVQRVLELEDYAVTAVNDGKAALEALANSRFDLAVLDVMMPFADGLTVCREARHRGINTKTDFDLLELLMQQPGIVVSRETIYETIWGYNFETNSKSLDVYIGYLRRKTEENNESRVVFTVRGVGYTVKQS